MNLSIFYSDRILLCSASMSKGEVEKKMSKFFIEPPVLLLDIYRV